MAEEREKLAITPEERALLAKILLQQEGRASNISEEDFENIERNLRRRRFDRSLSTIAKALLSAVLALFGAAILGMSGWILITILDLKTDVTVLKSDVRTVLEETKRSREAIDNLKATGIKLETLMGRIEQVGVTKSPPQKSSP